MRKRVWVGCLVVLLVLCSAVQVSGQADQVTHSPACVHYGAVGGCNGNCEPACPVGWEKVPCPSPFDKSVESLTCAQNDSIYRTICCQPGRGGGLSEYFVVRWDQAGVAEVHYVNGAVLYLEIAKTAEGGYGCAIGWGSGVDHVRVGWRNTAGQFVYAGTVCRSGEWPAAFAKCQ